MTIEEELSDIAADLVSDSGNRAFVESLLAQRAGSFTPLTTLVTQLPAMQERLREALAACDGEVVVAWLDYPQSSHGRGYCVIVFFHERLHWHTVALYNAALLSAPPHRP